MKEISCFLVALLVLLFVSCLGARDIKFQQLGKVYDSKLTANYTKVCTPEHFKKHGLNIKDFAYCNETLSYEVRVNDIVARLLLDEKVRLMGNRAVGAPRIGLPYYEWWSEALHGVSYVGPGTHMGGVVPGATSFPTVILSASSFNKTLWRVIDCINGGESNAQPGLGGLDFLEPNHKPCSGPEVGRIIETPGEDAYTVGTYAVEYVRGLQDVKEAEPVVNPNTRPLKVSSCCKHYAAYDLDNWLGVDRFHFNARVTQQDMLETFLRPFEMCVRDGDVSSVMCSYNRVDGFPTCTDTNLLKNTIRGEWNLHGYIVSDCDSIEVMVDDHKFHDDTGEDAVAQTLKAGLDLDCGDFYPRYLYNSVKKGKVREEDIDNALRYLYTVLMRLGFFDGDKYFSNLGASDVCSPQNIELATQASREGIVLLKNDNHLLPLNPDRHCTFAIIGPHSHATRTMIGNYAGNPCHYISPYDAFARTKNIVDSPGCKDVKCEKKDLIFAAMNASQQADATLLFMGLDLSIEAEGLDRTDLLLPGYQTQLINQVAESSKGPVILILFSAGGIDITFAKKNPKIQAILWAGYPGEDGGQAIEDVIWGKYNPGGKLPITWYPNEYCDRLPMTSMMLRPNTTANYPGRTYKFYDGPTVYPFGYGLSYTTFDYSLAKIKGLVSINLKEHQHCRRLDYTEEEAVLPCPATLVEHTDCDHYVTFDVKVKNTGSLDGNEVIMVYSVPPTGIAGTHIKQLVAFERVFVKKGEAVTVSFSLNVCKSFNIIDSSAYNLLPAGEHWIVIGDNLVKFPVGISFVVPCVN